MKSLHSISFILLIVGGLNWLLIGLFSWGIGDISSSAGWQLIARVVYILVGLAAIYEVSTHKTNCKRCDSGMGASAPM